MNLKALLIEFSATFCVTLVVAAAVSFLYSLIAHGTGIVDWGTAFRLALILGIVLPWMSTRARGEKKT